TVTGVQTCALPIFEGQAMLAAACDCDDSTSWSKAANLNGGSSRGGGAVPELAGQIGPPGQNGTIGLEGKVVLEARSDCDHSTVWSKAANLNGGSSRGGCAVPELTGEIGSPGEHRAIRFESQTVLVAGSDRDDSTA